MAMGGNWIGRAGSGSRARPGAPRFKVHLIFGPARCPGTLEAVPRSWLLVLGLRRGGRPRPGSWYAPPGWEARPSSRWAPIRGESWAGGRGVDFAERTQSTRFLHNSGRADPLSPGRFCRTNPIRIGPPRFGSTTGAVGRAVLQNEPNPDSGPHPAGGRFCTTNPIAIPRSGSPPDCQPGPGCEVTRSASPVVGLPNPAIPCHHPGSRRSAGRFCRPNPIPGDVLPGVVVTGQRPPEEHARPP
ncbi:MAG: hypothetical protein JWO38_6204 [Gemmataceae bacterium]|nr:hypothetical protein [Gemmataceae bacterium]